MSSIPDCKLARHRATFRRQNPNLLVCGWDERDYRLWSQLRQLPSYGLVAADTDNPMIALNDAIALLERNAEQRFEAEWKARFCEAHE